MKSAVTRPQTATAPTRSLHRIAVVSETFAPESNGVAHTLDHLSRELRERGVEVDLVAPHHPARSEVREPFSHTVIGVPLPGYTTVRCGLVRPRTLETLWHIRPPDAVYVATEGPLGWAAVTAARRLGVAVVSGFHTRFDAYCQHYGGARLRTAVHGYLRWFHNRTDLTLAPTAALKRRLEQTGYRSVEVLRRGVDTERFHPEHFCSSLRASWKASATDPVVLYVGRLAAEKNLTLAVRAFRVIAALNPGARLVLVGDGPLRAQLEAEHPGFIFAGVRKGMDLARHYASADLFLFPSLTETFGNVTLEAMASGLPVVAFDDAAAGEQITHGRHGRLAPWGDEKSWLREAVALAGLPPLALRAQGLAAREAVTGETWAHIARRFTDLLAHAAGNTHPLSGSAACNEP